MASNSGGLPPIPSKKPAKPKGGSGNLPPIKVAKPRGGTTTGGTSERAAFTRFINAHKGLRQYAGQIWNWANSYGGLTPTELAAVLWRESGGNPSAVSSAGALGLAQILDNAASPTNDAGVPLVVNGQQVTRITAAMKQDPAFAIQYAAWRLSGEVQKYGGIDAAYSQGYNPGYTGPAVSSLLPPGYVGISRTPKQPKAPTGTGSISDPWVVLTPKGTFKYASSPTPPKGTITYGGQPVSQSQLTTVWKQTYADQWYAYTGKKATPNQIAQVLRNGTTLYTLGNQLAGVGGDPYHMAKNFQNSPIYKQNSAAAVAYAKSVLGQDWKPHGGIIRQAIAQKWTQATLYAHLRQLPDYQQGPEFKDNLAKNRTVFETIYGNIDQHDPAVAALVKQKTLAGWSQDELATWLRDQPAYKNTAEYQSKTVNFMSQLGLITGGVPTLTTQQVDQMLNSGKDLATAAKTAAAPAPPKRPVPTPGPGNSFTDVSSGGGY